MTEIWSCLGTGREGWGVVRDLEKAQWGWFVSAPWDFTLCEISAGKSSMAKHWGELETPLIKCSEQEGDFKTRFSWDSQPHIHPWPLCVLGLLAVWEFHSKSRCSKQTRQSCVAFADGTLDAPRHPSAPPSCWQASPESRGKMPFLLIFFGD